MDGTRQLTQDGSLTKNLGSVASGEIIIAFDEVPGRVIGCLELEVSA